MVEVFKELVLSNSCSDVMHVARKWHSCGGPFWNTTVMLILYRKSKFPLIPASISYPEV